MAHYRIDLHTHTTASDGVLSPTQLVQRAVDRGVTILGVTDHDTTEGLAEAQAAGQAAGLEIIPGVEFSVRHERLKHFIGIHLLGYFIDYQAPNLVEVMAKVKQGRIEQKIRQIELLQSFGFDIPVEAVFERVAGVPGRPHIAAVLMERHPGRFASPQDVFDEYLGSSAKAHVGRQFSLTVGEATAVIKEAGGLPVIAHPGVYSRDIDPLLALHNAKNEGVEGVEVFYPYDKKSLAAGGTNRWIEQVRAFSRKSGLLQTGGTDFHGRSHEIIDLGDMGLTPSQFAKLKQGWQQLRGTNVKRKE